MFANDIRKSVEKGHIYVLHVNLFQNGDKTHRNDIRHAISPLFEEHSPTVITRSGFLVEETISTEAIELDADVVVIGKSQKPKWRRLLSMLIGNEPAVELHLQEQTTATVEVVE
ncbi:universal stress protein [Natronorubrum sp. FCH18a]|uniref:universal stress protein n=1 Tax=Natronorubrum sp. FCH18a TaxID=3447018 RepID=UPI003F50EA69